MVPLYAATTEGVTVTVRPMYLDEPSDLFSRRFVFAYHIEIRNDRHEPVQLLSKHWTIFEATGQSRTLEGNGVVGLQPMIGPGDVHSYHDNCLLGGLHGAMEGSYRMRRHSGEFHVAIPRFTLTVRGN